MRKEHGFHHTNTTTSRIVYILWARANTPRLPWFNNIYVNTAYPHATHDILVRYAHICLYRCLT